MTSIIPMRGMRPAPKSYRSRSETMLLTPEVMKSWRKPPCQREVVINQRLRDVAEDIKETGGVITGTIILGELLNSAAKILYLIDGQHRREAAYMSGLTEFIAEVCIYTFESLDDMGDKFVKLNSSIRNISADDILRGMEGSIDNLKIIRKACQFVGYGNVRRNEHSPLLSMSVAVKAWSAACNDTTAPNSGRGSSASEMVRKMTDQDTADMILFLQTVYGAWQGMENARLWGALNLSLTGWLWQRLVVNTTRQGNQRAVVLKPDQFRRCCMSLSSNSDYIDWLVGRGLSPRNRSPAYKRIRSIFAKRLHEDGVTPARLPQPEWATF